MTQENERTDRRWGARVPYNRRVTVESDGLPRPARMRDLSVSGCFIETPISVEIGSAITVSFALDPAHGPTVSAQAKVARITPHGMGARFVYSDAETPLVIRRWIGAQQAA